MNTAAKLKPPRPGGEFVWEINKDIFPGFPLYTVLGLNRLANENTIISNCGGSILHQWKNPDLGPSSNIQLLDEKDKAEKGELQR